MVSDEEELALAEDLGPGQVGGVVQEEKMHVASKGTAERGKETFLQRLAIEEARLLVQQNGDVDIAVWAHVVFCRGAGKVRGNDLIESARTGWGVSTMEEGEDVIQPSFPGGPGHNQA